MTLFKRAAKLDQSEYDEKVAAGLDRAFKAAATRDVQLSQLRLVIFSDLHRGARDGADDFQRCEPAYSAALGWYLERGYQLYLLGDVEELWENDIGEVLPRYAGCAELEKAFMDGPGLTRFFGNHDIDWRDPGKVKKHLGPLLPGIEVLEALKLGSSTADRHWACCSSSTATRGRTSATVARGSRASSCARSGARSRTAWAGCRPRRPRLRPARQARHRDVPLEPARGARRAGRPARGDDRRPHAPPGLPRPSAAEPGAAGDAALEAEIDAGAGARRGRGRARPALRRARAAQRPRAARAVHAAGHRASDVLQHGLLLLPRPRRHGPGDRRRQGHPGPLARRRGGGAAQGARASHPVDRSLRAGSGQQRDLDVGLVCSCRSPARCRARRRRRRSRR